MSNGVCLVDLAAPHVAVLLEAVVVEDPAQRLDRTAAELRLPGLCLECHATGVQQRPRPAPRTRPRQPIQSAIDRQQSANDRGMPRVQQARRPSAEILRPISSGLPDS